MRATHIFYVMVAVCFGFSLTSCAKQRPLPSFDPLDLNPKLKTGGYIQKVDNFLVILDTSGTMGHGLQKSTPGYGNKLELAKSVVRNMNQTLPDIKLKGGLRVLGTKDEIVYGMTDHTQAGLDTALNTVIKAEGLTPIGKAINSALKDLGNTKGQTALIIVSDGIDDPTQESKRTPGKDYPTREAADIGPRKSPLAAAQNLKNYYSDKLCIYPVLLGNDPSGKNLMDQLAKVGGCGFAVNADDIITSGGMADYVEKVFLTKQMDSDGDGVLDSKDRCPHTPKGAPVNAIGCPLDSDGDGVFDYMDKCPDTSSGVLVDRRGCPMPIKEKVSINLHIEFDFDKADVRPTYHNHIKNVANFLTKYPEAKAVLAGHTDSIGTEQYNLGLSQKRVDNAKQYFVNTFGIEASRLTVESYGESQPIASNETEEGRQKNRRVTAEVSTTTTKK